MAKTHQINDWLLPEELAVSGTPVLVLFVHSEGWKKDGGLQAFSKSAARHDGPARFLVLDTDENPSVLADRGIRKLPTLVLYADGKEVARRTGPLGDHAVEDLLARNGNRS